jgi:hypothetical protein
MDNPPAFPNSGATIPSSLDYQDFQGMTLRDYFAAKAMQAFLSSWIIRNDYPETDLIVAEHAYAMADEMMKARTQ